MEWDEAIDGLIAEAEDGDGQVSASRYEHAPTPPRASAEQVSAVAPAGADDSADPTQIDGGDDDLPAVSVPSVTAYGDLPLAAPPAVSADSIATPSRPAAPPPLDQLDVPMSLTTQDAPAAQPPSMPMLAADTELAQVQPPQLSPASDIPHVQPPQPTNTTDRAVSPAPVLAQESLEVPSRYSAPDDPLTPPQPIEQILAPLQMQFPVARPSTYPAAIDEPGMFPDGLATPEFAEMVSEIAAFKMAQREAEMIAHVQDELAVALAEIERRAAL